MSWSLKGVRAVLKTVGKHQASLDPRLPRLPTFVC